MSTYQDPVLHFETVLRFRVMRQLNDTVRNPEGLWSLVFSTNSRQDAEEVAEDERKEWAACGDQFKVVDGGFATVITRTEY